MNRLNCIIAAGSALSLGLLAASACAESFNVPGGTLSSALDAYTAQSGIDIAVSAQALKDAVSKGVSGEMSPEEALSKILNGTGFSTRRVGNGVAIVRNISRQTENASGDAGTVQLAETALAAKGALETVTVTSSKIGGDVQNIPIAITAMSQEQLTQTQTAGGPDLVKQVPNLTFSKTNFTGYNIQIRGIGTQAISVTTDPAVAVAFNDIPFIRNHFFEQEFFDVSQVEVLRGPQGTLYGRNATAGVVNLVSTKPTDQYEALASVDVGNYNNRRLEGMLNVPIVGDKLDLRVAGEWTKRDGYEFNDETGHSIDGRDLWSGRMSVLFHPVESLTANLVWEHFDENDDRARSTKQLCTRDPGPSVVDGPFGPIVPAVLNGGTWITQGCLPGSLYAPTAFQAPNGFAIPFIAATVTGGFQLLTGTYVLPGTDPYAGLSQSQNLRVIDSQIDPRYRAKNDTLEFNADWAVTPSLTLTSQTGYNKDFLYSTEDFNRFNTDPNLLLDPFNPSSGVQPGGTFVGEDNEYCDPQLGCSTRIVGEDISREHAWQFSQELRLASNNSGPLNFSVGANYMRYQTVEDYFVLFNLLSLETETVNRISGGSRPPDAAHIPFDAAVANSCNPQPADPNDPALTVLAGLGCAYIDPNPLSQINGNGHNYFRSENPYRLNSYASFGEVYYQLTPDVKLTGGLRWTDDRKHFDMIPSWAFVLGEGYPVTSVVDQEWKEWTGRFNATWTPKLDFTDQSLFYASYGRGYKGGGANPPPPVAINGCGGLGCGNFGSVTHPLTFEPEFINAYELGTKNTLLDGSMTLNADVFFYDYKNYQISQIVDRTSINLNFNATVKGAEIESTWEPVPGLRFNFAGGYEDARLANGSQAIDLMDRTDGNPNRMVVKPFVTQTSNCVLPTYVVNTLIRNNFSPIYTACLEAYGFGGDPVTNTTYVQNPVLFDGVPVGTYAGFDPRAGTPGDPYTGQNTSQGVDVGPAPNNGEGIYKNLSGNKLPNAPPFTLSVGAQYSMPLSADWAGTARVDGYWQGNSFARVFNDKPYDQLHGYTNLNLSLIFTNQDGWQAMAYMKNVFDTTAITGAFLNSDDTGLTTNVFVTDPRLFGLRITKNW